MGTIADTNAGTQLCLFCLAASNCTRRQLEVSTCIILVHWDFDRVRVTLSQLYSFSVYIGTPPPHPMPHHIAIPEVPTKSKPPFLQNLRRRKQHDCNGGMK